MLARRNNFYNDIFRTLFDQRYNRISLNKYDKEGVNEISFSLLGIKSKENIKVTFDEGYVFIKATDGKVKYSYSYFIGKNAEKISAKFNEDKENLRISFEYLDNSKIIPVK